MIGSLNKEAGRIQKESLWLILKHFSGETKKSHEKPQSE
jgi:hypothetical protein